MRQFAVLSVIALGLFAAVGPAAPALGDKPPKWEYAELKFQRLLAPPPGFVRQPGAGVPVVPQVTLRWSTADGEIEEKGWQELADKLKAPAPKGEATTTIHKLRVLNRLGADGWEVIEHTGTDGTAGTATWVFKRRAP